MNKLPRETFLIIASLLDSESRFQLAYVCKNYYSTISTYNLYETVNFNRDYEESMAFFSENEEYGSTVRKLQVNSIGIQFSEIQEWPSCFPNLQILSLELAENDFFEIDFDDYDEGDDEECYEKEGGYFDSVSSSFMKWNKLASISEFSKILYTGSILRSGKFLDLTVIDLNFNLVPNHAVDNVVDNLIMGLKNAPNLKFLKLIVAKLTLSKLNSLHQNIPRLEGLILENISMGTDSTVTFETKDKLQPAYHLKRLEMEGSRHSFYENETISIRTWLDYISQMYTNIEILKMNQFTPANEEYDQLIVNTVKCCKHLKTFTVDFCYFSVNVLSAFDQTAIQLETYCSVSQDLTQLRNLSLSKHRNSIYRLDLVVPIRNTDMIQIVNRFTGLTTLKTHPSSDIDHAIKPQLIVPLNTFLKQHKFLQYLSLVSCIVTLDPADADNESFTSVLDTLELDKVYIDSVVLANQTSIFDCISKYCLDLKVLFVIANYLDCPNKVAACMNLSNLSFYYMKIYVQGYTNIILHQETSAPRMFTCIEGKEPIIYEEQQINGDVDHSKQSLDIRVQSVEKFVTYSPTDPFIID